jgi:hypothetical protein
MDLSVDRVLSIAPFYLPLTGNTYTPTASGAPLKLLTTGSTATGATNEGLRTAMFSLFDTKTDSTDSVALMLDCIQRTSTGTIVRSCLHIKSYMQPDNGGDTSGILSVSTGGGPGLTVYKTSHLRPTGFTDYSTSPQPAIEVGSSDAGPALIASGGVTAWGASLRNHAIEARLGSATTDGILIWPTNNTFDDRLAFIIGSPQSNAAPVNVTAQIQADGDAWFKNLTLNLSSTSIMSVIANNVSLANSANSGTAFGFIFNKSRAGGAVIATETLGDIGWNFTNTTPVSVQGALIRATAADPTATSEDVDLNFFQQRAGTLTNGIIFRSTGKIEGAATVGGDSSTTLTTKGYVDSLGGGGGAPTTATYLTLSTDGTLTNERVLTAGTGLTSTDSGAGAALTLSIADNGVTAAKVAFNYATSTSEGGPATTATALAANGTNCSASQAATGVDASGNAEGCFTPGGGINEGWTDTGILVTQTTTTDNVAVGVAPSTPVKLSVSNNSAAVPANSATGTILHLSNADATNTRLLIDTYGAGNSAIDFRHAGGTGASRTAIGDNDLIAQITAFGYGTTGYSSGARASIRMESGGAWTDADQPARIAFYTTPVGSTTQSETGRIDGSGNLGVDGRIQIGDSSTAGSASCVARDSGTDRLYGDKDCDTTKDAGEEFLDEAAGGGSAVDPVTSVDVVDEFWSRSSTTTYGAFEWGSSASSAGVHSEASHPGAVAINTDSSSGNVAALYLGPNNTWYNATTGDIDRVQWIIKTPADVTNTEIRLGFMQNCTSTDGGSSFLKIEVDRSAGDTTWRLKSLSAGSTTNTDSTVTVVAATWYLLEIRKNGSDYEIWINGTERAQHSTNVPTGVLEICMVIENETTSSRQLVVDMFRYKSGTLTRY